ncbi:hypothetical protein M5K25_014374 [Dendrobium thyrsiflorum]|uniref:Uncharacterized protein n=1 Tax=Dendrobium thyrsiflorum TaxID=117978 RepID=A0ABD0UW15_DENTH
MHLGFWVICSSPSHRSSAFSRTLAPLANQIPFSSSLTPQLSLFYTIYFHLMLASRSDGHSSQNPVYTDSGKRHQSISPKHPPKEIVAGCITGGGIPLAVATNT